MPKKKKVDENVVWKGHPALRPFLVPLSSLTDDPDNVNTHDDESIGAIANSYARFGQYGVIVTDAGGTVKAGNGQFLAAGERLGWTHIAAIDSGDIPDEELGLFALAHNRTGQFSILDDARLRATLKAAVAQDIKVADLGWNGAQLLDLLRDTPKEPPAPKTPKVFRCPECGHEWDGKPGQSTLENKD